jgi:uncharacterized membrane protein (DUF4010 family)
MGEIPIFFFIREPRPYGRYLFIFPDMTEPGLFLRFGVALAIGILIGLQREYASGEADRELPAGARTFALLGLTGCTAALLSEWIGAAWPFVGVLLVTGGLFAINYYFDAAAGKSGLTTKAAAILTVLIGGLAYSNHLTLAVALGVSTTLILSIKPEMHNFVRHINRDDFYAALKLAVISAIILPVLPNRVFGQEPFNIFNPFKIWLLVVFISGISFIGYILMKIYGARKGIGLTGFLGGVASSTALTLSLSERSAKNPELSSSFALAIIVAWTVMYARVLAIIAVLNRGLAASLWPAMAASVAVGFGYCFYLYRRHITHQKEEVHFANPFELGPAIKFGLVFTLVLGVAKAAQVYLGNPGIYLSSFIAGLADIDAIALSLARFSLDPNILAGAVAAKAIVLATIANNCVKTGIILAGGSRSLFRGVLPGFILMVATGIVFVVLI